MPSILVVSDGHGSAEEAAELLRGMGNRICMCGGGPGPYAPCPLLRFGSCPLTDGVDVIIFAFRTFPPAVGRAYGGSQLLRAYRTHPYLRRIPMVIAVEVAAGDVEGDAPVELLRDAPDAMTIALAAKGLLATAGRRPFGPDKGGRMDCRDAGAAVKLSKGGEQI